MPRKCSVLGCKTGYDSQRVKGTPRPRTTVYSFPLKDPVACQAWLDQMPNNGLTSNSVTSNHGVCAKHWPDDLPRELKRKSGKHLVPSVPPWIFADLPPQSSAGQTFCVENSVVFMKYSGSFLNSFIDTLIICHIFYFSNDYHISIKYFKYT